MAHNVSAPRHAALLIKLLLEGGIVDNGLVHRVRVVRPSNAGFPQLFRRKVLGTPETGSGDIRAIKLNLFENRPRKVCPLQPRAAECRAGQVGIDEMSNVLAPLIAPFRLTVLVEIMKMMSMLFLFPARIAPISCVNSHEFVSLNFRPREVNVTQTRPRSSDADQSAVASPNGALDLQIDAV